QTVLVPCTVAAPCSISRCLHCYVMIGVLFLVHFLFNDTATTEIYTLSLHDALPIYLGLGPQAAAGGPLPADPGPAHRLPAQPGEDRKSTRLNSSHVKISYAVFCLKKKN